ncbi:unnamed protein product, partial [Owenia fusiformis]
SLYNKICYSLCYCYLRSKTKISEDFVKFRQKIQTADGTTWMIQIVSLILAKGDVDKANEKPIHERVPFLELYGEYKQLKDMPIEAQRCMKSHLQLRMLPKQTTEKKVKVIYVARNPKDTAVSFYHLYRMDKTYNFQGTWNEFFEMYIDGYLLWGNWFDHIKQYWNAKQDGTFSEMFLTTYEDMHKNPFKSVKDVATFLNVELDENTVAKIATESSFDKMKANPNTNFRFEEWFDLSKSEFMRKGKVGDWKNYFTVNQSEQFDKRFAEKMEGCSWKFDYE